MENKIIKSTREQLLRNSDIQPTSEVIQEALGEASEAYFIFARELENRDIHIDWRYYKDGKAWLGKGLYKWTGVRGAKKETTLFWLSIWDSFFKVTIYVSEKARAEALKLPLADEVKQMIGDSRQMGQLKFFPVIFELRSDEIFGEIYTLIDFKKRVN